MIAKEQGDSTGDASALIWINRWADAGAVRNRGRLWPRRRLAGRDVCRPFVILGSIGAAAS
ncbi:hypothetical protein EFV37_24380 [Mesorhizobium loti]|uniref:Uncharacterized protein n=1 Tax=Mesorhizobium jarvisii TaxID=1777867 RepID=A0A6M7TP60_9HYPH|nr:hypothetical protein A9K72_09820 [Mesorhizobium loti]QKC65057.1 hypothetical protein EB229_24375 [Mesorhizobium jarvisii]QKD10971.1 hypothetical protein EFV37_24380 [Mesorhizobium loti]RJT31227.1 hypothetical protein D3242_23560 [Mesorhizobium jarvisii]